MCEIKCTEVDRTADGVRRCDNDVRSARRSLWDRVQDAVDTESDVEESWCFLGCDQ